MTPALLCLLLLGADDALPPGHPPIPRSDAGVRVVPGPVAPGASLPPGHPAIPSRLDGGQPVAPTGAAPGSPLPPGHPDVKRGATPPSAGELLQQLDATPDLKTRPKPFEVSAALGKLYFTQGRYADAVVYFRQAVETAAPLRALALAERRKAQGSLPDAGAAGCRSGPDVPVGAVEARAKDRAAAGDHATAAACAREALGPALEAGGLLGNALFLEGDASGALAAYGWVLEVEPTQPEALYGRAGVRFDTRPDDVASLRLVKKDLTALLAAWPQIPQAPQARALLDRTDELIRAGGATKFAASRPKPAPAPAASAPPRPADVPQLSPETVEAIRNTERTPELAKGLADLIEQGEAALVQGQYQAALDAYRRVMPFEPDNGRTKAGMAWALVGLNRQPMADRVWGVAVGTDPAAVDALGDLLARKGNAKEARALWAKLAASAPDYARRVNLQNKVQ